MYTPFLLLHMLGLNTPAPADARALDRVHVYADFRQNSTAAVPASVLVLDSKALKARAPNHFGDLLGGIANLNWQAGSSRPRYFQIRGIGEDSQYQGAPNPSVGFMIDDVDFSGIGSIASTFDVERVEVLRGPQGTRYGANALAGLISIKSNDPGEESEWLQSASVGSDNHAEIGTVLSGPINPALGLRIAAQKTRVDGFRRNVFLNRDDTNKRDEALLRVVARYRPSDAFRLRISTFAVNLDNGYDAFAIDNSALTQSDQPGRDAQYSRAFSARADWNLANSWDLTALAGLARTRSVASFDGDWGNEAFFGSNGPYDFFSDTRRLRDTRSLELRAQTAVGRADVLIGAYLLDLDEDLAQTDRFNGAQSYALESQFGAQSRALFAESRFAIGTRDTVVVGGRGERRRATYRDSENLDFEPTDSLWGGSVSWLRSGLLGPLDGYLTLARGYKAGGFNLGLNIPLERRQFDPETLLNLEWGLKGSSADGRVRAELSIFVAKRTDQQVATSFQADPSDPLTFVFFTDNAASGRNRGAEGSLAMRVATLLSVDLNVGVLDTRIEQCACGTRVLNGREQANAPRLSGALGFDLGDSSGWFGRAEATHRGAYFFSDSHDQKAKAATLFNARVGYQARSWSASLWARNLFNQNHAIRGFFFGNEPPDFPNRLYLQRGDPRWMGLSFEVKF